MLLQSGRWKVLLVALGLALFIGFLFSFDMVVLSPKGWVGLQQQKLLIWSTSMMLIVVIPVFVLALFVTACYRKGGKGRYQPEWNHSTKAEIVWWTGPLVIIAILSWATWVACHRLDPFRPLAQGKGPALEIEVVALPWKWLFVYPKEGIALVNELYVPVGRELKFRVTADAPMNSFWIPALGGQIYAMAGMESRLHLIADEVGTFRGSSANLSGEGFSGMVFTTYAVEAEEYQQLVEQVRGSPLKLNLESYGELLVPSSYVPRQRYVLDQVNLYDSIIDKYMKEPSS
jgi:cytochrome o ubiquinol oxidase subunit 2